MYNQPQGQILIYPYDYTGSVNISYVIQNLRCPTGGFALSIRVTDRW